VACSKACSAIADTIFKFVAELILYFTPAREERVCDIGLSHPLTRRGLSAARFYVVLYLAKAVYDIRMRIRSETYGFIRNPSPSEAAVAAARAPRVVWRRDVHLLPVRCALSADSSTATRVAQRY
jgi:hypothetical protein